MVVVHLTGSPFFGGPERQMLGLARSLPSSYRSAFLTFAEGGRCRALLEEVERHGFEGVALEHNAPHVRRVTRELAGHLRRLRADVLCCHGYKADVLGWLAARRAGVPVVAFSHGWTAATLKVRFNEFLDRVSLHGMDRVVCVSKGQAARVRRAGVPADRVVVIRNAIRAEAFAGPDPHYRTLLHGLFPQPYRRIIGAAGRLSPEKGFANLVEAAAVVAQAEPDTGFVLFGDGPLRQELAALIAARGLADRFVLAGFRTDLERFYPHLDLSVLPSFTEGLPVVVLESLAAGVPVVATAVGGTPEVVEDGVNGYLVAPGQPAALAQRILDLLEDDARRCAMGARGRQDVREHFTFEAQSVQFQHLVAGLQRRGTTRNGRQPPWVTTNHGSAVPVNS